MYGKSPNCQECVPEIMEENKVILDVYLKVRSQHIMGMNGPVDVNINAIKTVMDLMKIEDQANVFDRVYNIYNKVLSRMREIQEAEQATAQ